MMNNLDRKRLSEIYDFVTTVKAIGQGIVIALVGLAVAGLVVMIVQAC